MVLDKRLEKIAYYGRGPWENYVDRNTGSDIGYYESTVTGQYYDYIKPQECGGKSDVRWVALTDQEGDGVLIKAAQPLFMSALHYTPEDLDRARHRNGQERIYNMPAGRPEVYLNLDAVQMGLGGGSCGPGPMDKYRIKVEAVSLGYLMRPCRAGQTKLSREARKAGTLPHSVVMSRDEEGIVTLSGCGDIRYTTDGSDPVKASSLYSKPFRLMNAATVKAAAFSPAGGRSAVSSAAYTKLVGMVKRSGDRLSIAGCDSEQKPGEGPASNAVDGRNSTFWHSRWNPDEAPYPHYIAVDVGEVAEIGGITVQGRNDNNTNGNIKKYRVYVSTDGKSWNKPVAEGEFKAPHNSEQRIEFKVVKGRYVKLEALSEVENRPFAAIAELGVLIAL
jgi:beta-galactosidase